MNARNPRGAAPETGCPFSRLTIVFALLVAAARAWGAGPTPPTIAVQPLSQVLQEGQYALFEVVADGSLPLTYQWRQDGTNLAGASGSVLLLNGIVTNQAGGYTVVITNAGGAITSQVAKLTVQVATPRELWLGSPVDNGGGRVVFPVSLVAQGNEKQVSGSLGFNPAVLTTPTFRKSTNAANATLVTDPSQLGQGRLGFVYTLVVDAEHPADTNQARYAVLPPGLFPLGEITFKRAGGGEGEGGGEAGSLGGAGVIWTNQPVVFEARDATNGPLVMATIVMPQLQPAPGPMVFQRQSGLFTQGVTVLNVSGMNLPGVRVYAHDVTNVAAGIAVQLINANGYVEAVPYLEAGPLAPGQSVTLTAEYYVADRRTLPAPAYEARVAQPVLLSATGTQIAVDRMLYTNGFFLVDFPSVPTRRYYIQYKRAQDLENASVPWRTASPAATAVGARTQWLDNGPPKTVSAPATNRFYRVYETLP